MKRTPCRCARRACTRRRSSRAGATSRLTRSGGPWRSRRAAWSWCCANCVCRPPSPARRCPVGPGRVRMRRACLRLKRCGATVAVGRAAPVGPLGERAARRAPRPRLRGVRHPRARGAEEAGARFPGAEAERRAPALADLWEEEGTSWGAHVLNALRARALFQRDVHYIVRDGEVRIVDTSTGRVLPISRWTDGMHQARPLPAPEGDPCAAPGSGASGLAGRGTTTCCECMQRSCSGDERMCAAGRSEGRGERAAGARRRWRPRRACPSAPRPTCRAPSRSRRSSSSTPGWPA